MNTPTEEHDAREEEFHRRERWVTYQGKEIIVHDYTNLDGDTAGDLIMWLSDRVVSRGQRDLLMLTELSGADVTSKAVSSFKEATKINREYIKKVAVIGARGPVKYIFHIVASFAAVRHNARLFEKQQDALDWLVE